MLVVTANLKGGYFIAYLDICLAVTRMEQLREDARRYQGLVRLQLSDKFLRPEQGFSQNCVMGVGSRQRRTIAVVERCALRFVRDCKFLSAMVRSTWSCRSDVDAKMMRRSEVVEEHKFEYGRTQVFLLSCKTCCDDSQHHL